MKATITRTHEEYQRELKLASEIKAKGCIHCGKDDKLDLYRNYFTGGMKFTVTCLHCGTRYEVEEDEK